MEIDLAKVLAYSKDCLQNRAQMRAIMMDMYPGKTREMNVLLDVYESGVPRKIKNDGNITDIKYAQFVQKIVDDYAMQEQWAVIGLNAWIDLCLGKGTAATVNYTVSETSTKSGVSSRKNTATGDYTNPVTHKNPITQRIRTHVTNKRVVGKTNDYEITDLGYGTVEISKFVGVDQADTVIPTEINGKKVIGVGSGPFKCCKGIKRLIVPEGIEHLDREVFAECSNLMEIILPTSLYSIGRQDSIIVGTFRRTAITEIDLPDMIKIIPNACFKECRQLRKVQLPDNLEEIGDDAFMYDVNLTDIQLPSSLKSIGRFAFCNCRALKEITIPSSVEKFGKDIFNLNNNILIRCYPGSKASEYARENHLQIAPVTWMLST